MSQQGLLDMNEIDNLHTTNDTNAAILQFSSGWNTQVNWFPCMSSPPKLLHVGPACLVSIRYRHTIAPHHHLLRRHRHDGCMMASAQAHHSDELPTLCRTGQAITTIAGQNYHHRHHNQHDSELPMASKLYTLRVTLRNCEVQQREMEKRCAEVAERKKRFEVRCWVSNDSIPVIPTGVLLLPGLFLSSVASPFHRFHFAKNSQIRSDQFS